MATTQTLNTGQVAEELVDVANLTVEDRANRSNLTLNKKRTPIHIKWEDIHYSIAISSPDSKPCNKEMTQKTILDNISGEAKPGTLVAIMGPSGSGKTTLLNCLARRIVESKGSILEGKITLNGVDREELGSKFARIAAYVQQDDILFNMQTVNETLVTAAKLRLSKEVTLNEKTERSGAIIQELGLSKAKDTQIGDANKRGVSGGERKRTNIGVEMIQDPSVLFLDEPTSGLDSFQALNVVETLKILCQSGCTVIMSIHQPRSSIFQLFDQLILLADGKLVYSGAAGQTAVDYFGNAGFQCPHLFNPADYFLDIISVDNRTPEEEDRSKKRIEFLTDAFDKHQFKQQAKAGKDPEADASTIKALTNMKSVTSGIWTQLVVLGIRSTRQIFRDKFTLGIRTFMTIFFAVFLAMLYSGISDDQKSIQDKQGLLFFITINQSFGPLVGTLAVFLTERSIVTRERQSKSYHLSTYYFTKLLTSLPLEVIYPCIFGSIIYFIANLKDDFGAFIIFLVVVGLTSLASISMGFAIGAFAPSIDAGNAIAPLIIVLSVLFGGFYINTDNIPVWIRWLDSCSHIRWAFTAFCINEFTDSDFDGCDIAAGDTGCYENGDQILELLSMDKFSLWDPLRNLLLITLFYHTLAFLILKFKRKSFMEVSDPLIGGHRQSHSQVGLITQNNNKSPKQGPTDVINPDMTDDVNVTDNTNNNGEPVEVQA